MPLLYRRFSIYVGKRNASRGYPESRVFFIVLAATTITTGTRALASCCFFLMLVVVMAMSTAATAAFRLTTFSMVMLVVTMCAATAAAFCLIAFSMVMLVVAMPAATAAAFRIFNESDTDITGDFVIGWIGAGLDDFSIHNSDRQNCVSFRFDFFIDHFVGFELLRIIRQIEKQSFIVL